MLVAAGTRVHRQTDRQTGDTHHCWKAELRVSFTRRTFKVHLTDNTVQAGYHAALSDFHWRWSLFA